MTSQPTRRPATAPVRGGQPVLRSLCCVAQPMRREIRRRPVLAA